MNNKQIIVKPPNMHYITSALFIVAGGLSYWGLGQAAPSNNPEYDSLIRVLIPTAMIGLGIIWFVYWETIRIVIDDNGISIRKAFSFRTIKYDWEDITSAKEVHWTFLLHRILNRFFKEIVHYPGEKWINLYSSNRRIIKVHSYFHGYSAMIEELMERGIIQVN